MDRMHSEKKFLPFKRDPLLCLLAVLALGPLVLPGHRVSEVTNFGQFSNSCLEHFGLMGKEEEPCYLLAHNNN